MLKPFSETSIRRGGRPWPFANENAAAIEAHWNNRVSENPAIFNGRTLMAADIRLTDGRLSADMLDAEFKAFLYWRDHGFPDESVKHLISLAAVVTSDNALLLGEMGPQNVTGGLIYPPCGTFSFDDVTSNGIIDDKKCAIRELAEETGLNAAPHMNGGGIVIWYGAKVALVRLCRVPMDARDVRAFAEAHLNAQSDPELAAIHLVTGPGQIPSGRSPRYVEMLIQHLFA